MIGGRGVLLGVVLVVALGAPALAQPPPEPPAPPEVVPAPPPGPPALASSAGMLVELPGGHVLYQKDPHARRAPASLTKVVTALVARDRYPLDEIVVTSPIVEQAWGSVLGLRPGVRLTVRDMLYALLLKSGNDVALALADHDPGGYDVFIERMNEKARAIGAHDSHFVNPHGLDAPGHTSSAWDIALFGRQLLADTVLADIVATPEHTVLGPDGFERSFDNHNKLIARDPDAIGVKTGFTNQAGHSLLAASRIPGGTALTVVLDSPDHYAETSALFAYAKARAAEQGSAASVGAEDLEVLAVPPQLARLDEPAGVASLLDIQGDRRWTALLALLAAAMLATLTRARRTHPLAEAAQFHAYLEPLVGAAGEQAERRRRRGR